MDNKKFKEYESIEEEKLWEKFSKENDQGIRDYFVIKYAPLVKYVAGKVSMGMPQNIEFEDLVSYGIFGLLDAIGKFDPARGIKFKTYAMTRIRGAIFDELRSIDWIPRSIRQKAKQIEQIISELENKLGRTVEDEETYGKSEYFELQFNYLGRKIGFDLNLHRYKGFYLANPEDFDDSWHKSDPYPQIPNLNVLGADFNLFYIFSGDRLSLSASFDQSERQLKSAGSFMLMFSSSYLLIYSDEKLIPLSQQPYYGSAADFDGGSFSTVALSPGYAYTFLAYNFYFTPMIFAGPGYQWKTFFINGNEDKSSNITTKIHLRASLGYNFDDFFSNLSILLDNTNVIHEGGTFKISPRSVNIALAVGYKI